MQADLIVLGVTILCFFIIGIPLTTRTVHLPEEFSFDDVPDSNLTEAQRNYFEALDRQMVALGYSSRKTFKVSNLQNPNITRAYASMMGSGCCYASCISSADPNVPNAVNYVEFSDEFTDGTVVITRNGGMSDPFKAMPNRLTKTFPGLVDLAVLKSRHDDRVKRITALPVAQLGAEALYARINEHHRLFCDFQRSAGMLRHVPEQERYFATKRCALAGVLNFLNPLADNFTIPRALSAILLGAFAPIAAFVHSDTFISAGSSQMVTTVWTISLYLFSGAALGFIFTSKVFIWAFLVGYLPLSLWGIGDSHFLLGVAMGYVAHKVASWRLKRQYIAEADAGVALGMSTVTGKAPKMGARGS